MSALTPFQISKLEKLESEIRQGLQTFVDVGCALTVIRDEKLYRRDYDTFEAYCQERWGWSRQRSSQLINAAELMDKLPPTLAAKVTTEREARALLLLEPAEQKQVIREAAKEGVPIAEKAKSFSEKPVNIDRTVSTQVDKVKKKEPARLDKEGWPIPPVIIEAWDRADEAASSGLSLITKLRSMLREGEESQDIIFGEVKVQENIALASQLFDNFKQIKPHAVCTVCNGRGAKDCLLCKGRGFLSSFSYKMFGDAEVKKIRAKAIAK